MLPLFLPDGAATRLRALRDQHAAELQTLLEPLETLSPSERDAVGAASLAAGVGRAWEANQLVLDRLLPASDVGAAEQRNARKRKQAGDPAAPGGDSYRHVATTRRSASSDGRV